MTKSNIITRDTSLSDFKQIIAADNQEAWNIVNKIMNDYKFEVVEALIESGLRGESIVKAYLDHGGKIECLVFWIMSKNDC